MRLALQSLLALAGAAALLAAAGVAHAAEQPGITLQLKWWHQFQFAGYYAAQAKGFYASEGLDVTIVEGGATRPSVPVVLAGKAQFGVGDTHVLLERLKGAPLVVSAVIFQHSPYVIMSRRDRGIRTPSDLVGARLMLEENQGATELRAMLVHEGIDPGAVKSERHSWSIADLIERRVDAVSAYATVEPAQVRARGVDVALLRTIDYGIDFYGDTLFSTEAELAAHPERSAAFVRASLKGWDYAFAHPKEIAQLILAMDGVAARGVTLEMLLAEADAMRAYVLPDVVEVGHMNPGRWKHIAGILVGLGLAPQNERLEGFVPKPEPWVDPRVRQWALGAAAVILLLAAGIVVLNVQVRRQVAHRTRSLREEIERREAVERTLRAREALLHIAGQMTRMGAWSFDVPENRLRWSDEVCAMHGVAASEVPRLEEVAALYSPECAQRFRAALESCLRDGTAYDLELQIGSGPRRGTWVRAIGQAARDERGAVRRLQGAFQDITERKRDEEEIRSLAARLTTTLESITDGFITLDRSWRFTYVNAEAERMLRRPRHELLGRNIWTEFAPAVGGTSHREYHRALAENHVVRFEEYFAPLDTWFEAHAYPSAQGLAVYFRDVSERRRAEREHMALESQLRESQKMEALGTLASGIAHDFNNILGAILGNVELARQDAAGHERVLGSLDEIRRAGHRARELVRRILAFTRREPMTLRAIALWPVVQEAAGLLRPTLPPGIVIEEHCAVEGLAVLADATLLQQVILNLGTNAAQAFAGGKGRIEMRLDEASEGLPAGLPPGRYARLSVIDDGPGMDAATRARIFEPFFTTKPVGEGTGLGLAVAHGIVAAHDGAIAVESEPGRGSRFDLYFPALGAAVAMAVAQPEPALSTGARAAAQSRHIVYIDDDESLIFLVKRVLERMGHRVTGYSQPQEALEALRRDSAGVDLVVTDHNMPGISGLDVARAIRGIRPGLPVALASGFVSEALRAEAAEAGVREIIHKEMAVESFCHVLDRVVPREA